uniref:Uncharacterized protein n=1 Tax=Rousettus aegyptiacus TaxID=9407 RepID=A0A7J8IP28_ROUAE|nr:hypothetical protein HJG63_010777 [Rousettus aegyptiacus]
MAPVTSPPRALWPVAWALTRTRNSARFSSQQQLNRCHSSTILPSGTTFHSIMITVIIAKKLSRLCLRHDWEILFPGEREEGGRLILRIRTGHSLTSGLHLFPYLWPRQDPWPVRVCSPLHLRA